MARKAALAAATAALAGAVATPAQAMRAYVNYDSVVVSAGPGETNLLTVRPDPLTSGAFLIIDPGATITPGEGCTALPLGRAVRCTLEEGYWNPSLSVYLGDGNDVAKVEGGYYIFQASGGSGNDRLDVVSGSSYTGVQLGSGSDTLELGGSYGAGVDVTGGDGNDTINAPDVIGGSFAGDGGDDAITASGWVYGGEGADTLDGRQFDYGYYDGGPGDDNIDTFDLATDDIDCGTGTDVLTFDEADGHWGCETLN